MTYSKKFETNSVTFKTSGHLLAKMALLPNIVSTKLTYFTSFIVNILCDEWVSLSQGILYINYMVWILAKDVCILKPYLVALMLEVFKDTIISP